MSEDVPEVFVCDVSEARGGLRAWNEEDGFGIIIATEYTIVLWIGDYKMEIVGTIVCFSAIGAFVAFVFVMMLINFNPKLTTFLELMIGIGGNGGILWGYFKLLEVTRQSMKIICAASLYTAFLLFVVLELRVLCDIIKDKDDKDVIRIRDILLGQKNYILAYYKKREAEIDNSLNISQLEERENDLTKRETAIKYLESHLEQEKCRIEELGKNKVKITLPENTKVTVTERFVNALPSYTADYLNCMINITELTKEQLAKETYTLKDFKAYLLSIEMLLSTYLFSSSAEIRIHFRYYDSHSDKYEKLIALTGMTVSNKNMTAIPFEGSMIKPSYECKRALIKSINVNYDYTSENNRVWKDYLTFAVYSVTRENKPILSFGISVKNETRFKDTFIFINYIGLENYLNEMLDMVNNKLDIGSLLYGVGGI